MKFSTNEEIQAPIETVFKMLCDFERFERAAISRGAAVERTDDKSEAGLGMAWKAGFKMRGKAREMDLEVISFEEPNEIVLESTSPGMLGTTSFELSPISGELTRVKVELTVKPLNLSARLLVQSLKLAKSSLTKKFKSRVSEYARDIEAKYSGQA